MSKEKKNSVQSVTSYSYTGKITLSQLASKLNKSASEIISFLFTNSIFDNGRPYTMNSELNPEVVEIICIQYNIVFDNNSMKNQSNFVLEIDYTDSSKIVTRPVVVVIAGHIDHGKTTLIDYLRKSRIVDKESGHITQSMGTYQLRYKGQVITVLDTPGHETFNLIRERGASLADVMILVIAADSGIQQQSLETIKYAKAANIDVIIAINKIDKVSEVEITKVKQELLKYDLVAEEYGGTTIVVPISAKKGTNIDLLMENLTTLAELKELKANISTPAFGTVMEAKLDKGKGVLTTVLVQNGTLHVGDYLVVGSLFGKVRNIYNDVNQQVKFAEAGTPVSFSGLDTLPIVGEHFKVFEDEHTAKSVAAYRRKDETHPTNSALESTNKKVVNVIIKAESQSLAEAAKLALSKIENKDAIVNVIYAQSGEINDYDLLQASTSAAIIYSYKLIPSSLITTKLRDKGIDFRYMDVIYAMSDDLTAYIEQFIIPEYEEVEIGNAEVLQLFPSSKYGLIAGCKVMDGVIRNKAIAKLYRHNKLIYTGKIESLRNKLEDVKEMRYGFECGINLNNKDILVGDIIRCYQLERK